MPRTARLLLLLLLVSTSLFVSCKGKEEPAAEPEAFRFVVYPQSRYLGQLTETMRQANRVLYPAQEPPPIAVYDTDAPLDQVAEFYVKEYGYGAISDAPPADPNAELPRAWRRSGELADDIKGVQDLLPKLNLQTDVTKAQGAYRAVELKPTLSRPRVTLQRPYFDLTTSQVVDRTLILMSRG